MDVSITAVNVARVPAHAVPSLPVGGVFAWPSPRTREQVLEAHDDAKERERQNGERVVRAQAPDEANVDVPFGETVGAVSRAAEDENVDLIVVGLRTRDSSAPCLEVGLRRSRAPVPATDTDRPLSLGPAHPARIGFAPTAIELRSSSKPRHDQRTSPSRHAIATAAARSVTPSFR